VNFSACGKRRFNNLRANFVREIPRKEFFNTHRRFHSLTFKTNCNWTALGRKVVHQSDEVVGHCLCERANSVVVFDDKSVGYLHLIYRTA